MPDRTATIHWIDPPISVGDSCKFIMGDVSVDAIVTSVKPDGTITARPTTVTAASAAPDAKVTLSICEVR